MIQIGSEKLIHLSRLAKLVTSILRDGSVHPSTVHRWRNPGVRGVQLECLRIGGVWYTSLEAFQRFCERLSALDVRDKCGSENNSPITEQTDQSPGLRSSAS